MQAHRGLWWRVLGGLVLAAAVPVWAVLVAAYLLGTPGHLIKLPRQWVMSFQVQRPAGKADLGLLTRRTAAVLRKRLAMSGEGSAEVVALPGGRLDARTPADGRSDPNAVIDLLRQTGVLEFRIAAGPAGQHIEPAEEHALGDLLAAAAPTGPLPTTRRFAWFRVAASAGPLNGLIHHDHADRACVLLSNEPNDAMLRDYRDGGWSVADAFVDSDAQGKPAVGFVLDDVGAAWFHRLTSSHVGKCLAMLLDDEVLSAPTVMSAIRDRGQIVGRFTIAEAQTIARVLRAGALPGNVRPEPISRVLLPPVAPPQAAAKRWLLWALGAVAALALAMGLRAAWRGRLAGLGLWGVLLIAAAGGWWAAVAWNNYLAEPFCRFAWFANAMVLVALLTVWSVAGIQALQARHAAGGEGAEGDGNSPDRV